MTDQKVSPADKFNAHVRKIFAAFKDLPSKKFKSKLHLNELQRKMNTGIQAEPKYAVTMLGPMLWSTKDEIKAGTSKYFLDKEYGMIVQLLSKTHKFNYDDAINTIAYMKESYQCASETQQKGIVTLVQELLGFYVEFILESRKQK